MLGDFSSDDRAAYEANSTIPAEATAPRIVALELLQHPHGMVVFLVAGARFEMDRGSGVSGKVRKSVGRSLGA